jgi:uncharacterized protein YndB with AHSA1/START domain
MLVDENQVRVEKTFRYPAPSLFRALSEGRLFFNCSGDYETFENDFRVGGRYRVRFRSYDITNAGHYLEIVANRKVAFTWGDEGADDAFPKTEVTVELFPEGDSTRLLLVHTGFTDRAEAEDHNEGWTGAITDFAAETEKGELRIVREFKVPRDRLFAACSDPRTFFGIVADAERGTCDFRVGGAYRFPSADGGKAMEGTFEKIVPGEEIVFTWMSACGGPIPGGSRVSLRFEDTENGSSLELVHSGLKTDELVRSHREGWNYLMNRLLQ